MTAEIILFYFGGFAIGLFTGCLKHWIEMATYGTMEEKIRSSKKKLITQL